MLPIAVVVILGGSVGILRLYEYIKLRRIRSLTCPDCGSRFDVSSLTAVKYWMEKGSRTRSGFYLRCARCGVEHHFTDDYRALGPVAQKHEETTG